MDNFLGGGFAFYAMAMNDMFNFESQQEEWKERIREELFKCFKHDTLKTLNTLEEFYRLKNYVFKNNILWLKPTLEQ